MTIDLKTKLQELRTTVFCNKSRLDNLVLTDNNYTNADKAKVATIGTIEETVVSNGADLAEVGTWHDGNPSKENRLYRFVTISGNEREISIANSNSQIVGTSNLKSNVGFLGNYHSGDESDTSKVIVSLLGVVPVKTNDSTIKENDRVVSDANGYAIKSTNNCGYRVLDVLGTGLLSIVVSPNTDMIQRIKTDMSKVENKLPTDAEKQLWNNKSDFSGNYNDLSNKPNIPSKTSQLTNDSGYITNSYHDDTKVDKVDGKGLSSNDYTDSDKNKLDGIEEGANKYVLPSNVVQDDSYQHTDNNYDDTSKAKVDAIPDNPKYTDTVYDDTEIKSEISELNEDLTNLNSTKSDINHNHDGVYLKEHQTLKTINNQSIIGEGNITIDGGSGTSDSVKYTPQTLTDSQKVQARENQGIVTLTQEEYDLIDSPNEATIYLTTQNDKISNIYLGVASLFQSSSIVIITQPQDWIGTTMENCSFQVVATGNNLAYRWYYRNPNTTAWVRDGSTSASVSTYSFKMYANYIGMGVKCLITDSSGNTMWSEEATIYGYSGIKNIGGTYYYFENADKNTTYVGLCEYNGVLYYISNGTIDWNFNGIVEYQGVEYEVKGGYVRPQN